MSIRITRSLFPPSDLAVVFPEAVLAPLVTIWRRLLRGRFDSYRPELHYMRGPGPKWREKHAYVASALLDSCHR
jgi:hypothetical protein